ncbi:MAG: aminotransferase class IV, partial [Myxococcales bacterium]|nr:aminotransferase class IV [Myxococcales bacterium]
MATTGQPLIPLDQLTSIDGCITERDIPRGLWTGEGVYETLLVRRNCIGLPALWRLHKERFEAGSRAFSLPWPGNAQIDRWLANALASADERMAQTSPEDLWWRVRLTLLAAKPFSPAIPPTRATLWITIVPATTRLRPPATLCTGPKLRNPADPLSGTKRVGLASDFAALRHAAARGFDDTLLLDVHGRVSEASTSTLLVGMKAGGLGSPALTTGCLPGTTLALLQEVGHDISPLEMSPQTLCEMAEWVVLLNAVSGARPVVSLDNHIFSPPPASFIAEVRRLVDASLA